MQSSGKVSWLGAGAAAFGVFLLFIAIPQSISKPSNIRVAVLSPTFWPVIIASMFIVLGALLLIREWFTSPADESSTDESVELPIGVQAWSRLLIMAVMMAAMIWAIPRIGMVWASMATVILFMLLVRSRRPVISLIVAVALPLLLYAFFAHVAGVAIPQGDYLQLP